MQEMNTAKQVLVVEDEPEIRNLIALHLERSNCNVEAVASGDEYSGLQQKDF